jgi:hypothetical protein
MNLNKKIKGHNVSSGYDNAKCMNNLEVTKKTFYVYLHNFSQNKSITMSNLKKFNLSYSLFSTMTKHAQLSASVLKELQSFLKIFKNYMIFNAKVPKE